MSRFAHFVEKKPHFIYVIPIASICIDKQVFGDMCRILKILSDCLVFCEFKMINTVTHNEIKVRLAVVCSYMYTIRFSRYEYD